MNWRLRIFDVDAMGYEELLQLAEELGSVPHPRATPEMLRRLPLRRGRWTSDGHLLNLLLKKLIRSFLLKCCSSCRFRYNGTEKEKCVICQEAL